MISHDKKLILIWIERNLQLNFFSVFFRQHKIQTALLNLGEFEAAFNEVLSWLDKINEALDDIRPVPGDPKAIDMEMAKHKVRAMSFILWNSITPLFSG